MIEVVMALAVVVYLFITAPAVVLLSDSQPRDAGENIFGDILLFTEVVGGLMVLLIYPIIAVLVGLAVAVGLTMALMVFLEAAI